MQYEWVLAPEPDLSLVRDIVERNGVHPAVASVLASRGFDAEASVAHLNPSLQDLHDPFSMKGMERAAGRVKQAIEKKEKVLVHGDYDVDGIAGVALLYGFLKVRDCPVQFYIPHRVEDGYGLSERGVSLAASSGASLIITVDCGTGDYDEIELARKSGIDVIVADHHEPRSLLPRAHTILNPKCEDGGYPFAGLCGCGVALKLVQAVSVELGENPEDPLSDLDLVALATVCDIVPMVGENRVLARFGMKLLSDPVRPGIVALKEVAGLKEKEVNVYHLGFVLGPRLNAAGRIASGADGARLLVTDDREEARSIATRLNIQNEKRKELNQQILEEASRMVEAEFDVSATAGIVLAASGWHEGVIGIVASRIVERFHRPTVIISLDGEKGKGSARSIRGFNLYGALEKCEDLLSSFGGHEQAAGLTIEAGNVPAFRERFDESVKESLSVEELGPRLFVDTRLAIKDVDEHLFSSVERLEPFGICNSRPVFLSEDTEVVGEPSLFGKGHLKFKVRDEGIVHSAVGYRMGEMVGALTARPRIRFVYSLNQDEYLGKKRIVLRVRDIRIGEK